MSYKITAGIDFPSIPMAQVGGGTLDLTTSTGWRMLVVYRGNHCPLCKKYLTALDGLMEGFKEAGVSVFAASTDPIERAEADVSEFKWRFPVGYDMTIDQMRQLGVYISAPRPVPETDRPFSEPAVFLVNPEGKVQVVNIANASFSRPDLASILAGIRNIQERKFPVRGTLE